MRSGTLTRKTRLRPFSKKRRKRYPARRRCLDVVQARSGGWCELRTPVCEGRGNHGHEKLTRARGGDDTDPSNVLWSCWPCNQWAHNHDAAATAAGLLTPSWEAPCK
jgi:hypothetical protein